MVDPRSVAQRHELERLEREEDNAMRISGSKLIDSSPWTMESQLKEVVKSDVTNEKAFYKENADKLIKEAMGKAVKLQEKYDELDEQIIPWKEKKRLRGLRDQKLEIYKKLKGTLKGFFFKTTEENQAKIISALEEYNAEKEKLEEIENEEMKIVNKKMNNTYAAMNLKGRIDQARNQKKRVFRELDNYAERMMRNIDEMKKRHKTLKVARKLKSKLGGKTKKKRRRTKKKRRKTRRSKKKRRKRRGTKKKRRRRR